MNKILEYLHFISNNLVSSLKKIIISDKIISDNKFKLCKDNILNSNKEEVETPEILLKNGKVVFLDMDNYLRDIVCEFLERITSIIPEDILNILYNNINSLTISNKFDRKDFFSNLFSSILSNSFISGYYILVDNNIKIIPKFEYYMCKSIIKVNSNVKQKYSYNEYLKNVLFHELLHMSSTVCTTNNKFSGFSQNLIDCSIGNSLTEGYTEVLLYKFFFDYSLEGNSYKYEKVISKAVESIIGFDKMSSFYFRADLFGLLNELSKYSSFEDAKQFIIDLDNINLIIGLNITMKEKITKLKELSYKINLFLVNCYINKLRFDDENIDMDDVYEFYELLHTIENDCLLVIDNEINIDELLKESVFIKRKRREDIC